FNPGKYGWPWIPGTVSWVIPTAFSIIALEQHLPCCPKEAIENRILLGREMLRDRACTEGGWNAGNSIVDGAALLPHIDTTAIGLLAMRESGPVVHASLNWLRAAVTDCESEYSLAWAALALSIHHNSLFEFCIERLAYLLREKARVLKTETLCIAALALNASANDANPFRTEL